MKVGDIVSNPVRIGVGQSIREPGQRGLVVGVEKVKLLIGSSRVPVERTDITVLLDDGAMYTYDSGGFDYESSPLK